MSKFPGTADLFLGLPANRKIRPAGPLTASVFRQDAQEEKAEKAVRREGFPPRSLGLPCGENGRMSEGVSGADGLLLPRIF